MRRPSGVDVKNESALAAREEATGLPAKAP
jgi:hypothetical protein